MDRIDVIVPNDKDFGFYPRWKSRNNDIKNFFENYSKTTKKLGEKAHGSQWNLDDETKNANVADFTTGDGVYTVEFDVAVSIGGISEKVIVNFDMFGVK